MTHETRDIFTMGDKDRQHIKLKTNHKMKHKANYQNKKQIITNKTKHKNFKNGMKDER